MGDDDAHSFVVGLVAGWIVQNAIRNYDRYLCSLAFSSPPLVVRFHRFTRALKVYPFFVIRSLNPNLLLSVQSEMFLSLPGENLPRGKLRHKANTENYLVS
jgi:hypothetical protein